MKYLTTILFSFIGILFFLSPAQASIEYFYSDESAGWPHFSDIENQELERRWTNTSSTTATFNFVQFQDYFKPHTWGGDDPDCGHGSSSNTSLDLTYQIIAQVDGQESVISANSAYISAIDDPDSRTIWEFPPIDVAPSSTVSFQYYVSDIGTSGDICLLAGSRTSGGTDPSLEIWENDSNTGHIYGALIGFDTDEGDTMQITFPTDGNTIPTGSWNVEGYCPTPGLDVNVIWWASPYTLCPPTVPDAAYIASCNENHTFALDETNQYLPLIENATTTRIIAWDENAEQWFQYSGSCNLLTLSDHADVINITIDDDYYATSTPSSCSISSGIREYSSCQMWWLINDFADTVKDKIPFGYISQFRDAWRDTATSSDQSISFFVSSTTASSTSDIDIEIYDFGDIEDQLDEWPNIISSIEFVIDIFFVVFGLLFFIGLTIKFLKR
jgi:hypothetical protein